jgi:hypothetical protein
VTARQCSLVERVRRHPKGPGKSMDVVLRPVLLWVWRGPFLPPVVMDQECRLMFSRTPGRIRKLLRNVSGMSASSMVAGLSAAQPGYPVPAHRWVKSPDPRAGVIADG